MSFKEVTFLLASEGVYINISNTRLNEHIGVVTVKQNDILLYLISGGIFGFLFGTMPNVIIAITTLLGAILAILVGIFRELLNISKKMEEQKK